MIGPLHNILFKERTVLSFTKRNVRNNQTD